jgi:branched-chain amino acid transport system substrate-binding protein
MRRGAQSVMLALALLAASWTAACDALPSTEAPPEAPTTPPLPEKDTIRIGHVTSLSGPSAAGVAISSGPVYDMWVDEVNARGGIYVAEYGKKLPIDYIKYDDQSDLATMTEILEKVLVEEDLDFIFPPWSTSFLYAAAPIANEHGYILIGGAGGAAKLKELRLPYFFQVLNFSETQMPVLADVLVELGVQNVAIIFIGDLHGIEYSGVAAPEFASRGLEVKMIKSYAPGIEDMSPFLQEAKALDVDAFIGFSYPNECILATAQAMDLGINFDVFHLNVGPCFPFFRDTFGADAVEGIMGPGAWNPNSSPGARQFFDAYVAHHGGEEPDMWGGLLYYSSLQHFEQAIVEAGTLDQAVIRDVLATRTYDTALGQFWYDERQMFTNHVGEMGQWQNGVWEVIDPGENRTAAPILKPNWPGQ